MSGQYQLITHTAGGALDFQDQVNDQNLVSVDGNLTTASVIRFNNSNAFGVDSPIGYMSKGPGGYTCYDPSSGQKTICLTSNYCVAAMVSGKPTCSAAGPTWTSVATAGPSGFAPAGSPAAKAGATWDSLWSGNAAGSLNTVKPIFTNASVSDQFRPNDKLLINASVRYDNFTYDLPDSAQAADQFYANMTANYTCVQASTNNTLTALLAPGQPPPASAVYVEGNCDIAAKALKASGTGWVHPNGTVQNGVHRSELHGDIAELVLAQLLAAALLGDVHGQSGYGLPSLRRPLRCAADLGLGPVPRRVGRRPFGLEQHDGPGLLFALPSDSGYLVRSV